MKTSPTPCRPGDAQSADLFLLKGLPIEDDSPVFREPWEAQAFGMALFLHERGLFTWDEWTQALSTQIRAAQTQGDPDLGNTYYRHWLTTIETLVSAKGISSPEELARYRQAWDHAADRVPHGKSVVRIPRDGGHDSRLMADSVPPPWRTPFHGDGGQHSILMADT